MRKRWLRSTLSVVLGTLLLLSAASCGSARGGVSHLTSKNPAASSPQRPLGSSSLTPPATLPPLVAPSTVINTYPNPYNPGYTNIDQLVHDSIYIAIGTLEAPESGTASNGSLIMAYPVSVQKDFGTVPDPSLDVDQAEVTAANLTVGDTYVFFWGFDRTPDNAVCIVGGVRGVMAYDAATDIVTRLDNSSSSQIPRSQSLEEFISSIEVAQKLFSTQPIRNQPSVCSLSATGGVPGE